VKRGLVIGKFMPLHKGHIALIHFAAKQCDELVVSMTHKLSDPIPGPLRFEWIKSEFKNFPNIKPDMSADDFDDVAKSLEDRMPLWSAFLKRRFPYIDIIISSEVYGEMLAKSLGIEHIVFDMERLQVPVSGSKIRADPFRHWDFIADPAKSYFVKKICFYGPESTGKSFLAEKLAARYKTVFVPEVARELILNNDFNMDDVLRIGNAQTKRVIEKSKIANKLLFCDTDLITTQVYSRQYLGSVPPILYELETRVRYDRYFFFNTDVEWVADGMRDLGDRREEMFNVFKRELHKRGIGYDIVSGDYTQREKFLVEKISEYFGVDPDENSIARS
jgi:HTH-type transcriptional repressor of NAD biosynthesis genes